MVLIKAADVLELALELEKNGEAFYRAVARKTGVPEVQALFEDLAQQEVFHYRAFQKLAQTTWDTPLMPPEEWQEYLSYLQATVQSAFFEGKNKSLAMADQVASDTEAIRMAMGFEKETILFFHDLRDLVPEGHKETVARIIAEEKSHLRRLAGML